MKFGLSKMATFLFLLLSTGAFSTVESKSIPRISLAELQLSVPAETSGVLDGGGRISAFTVTDVSPELAEVVRRYRKDIAQCFRSPSGDQFPQVELSDGSIRKTFATTDGRFPDCLLPSAEELSLALDPVEVAVASLVEAVVGRKLTFREPGEQYPTSLVKAPRKDHMHLYFKHEDVDEDEDSSFMVPYHVDNGLFLLLTPFPGHPLQLKTSDGSKIDTSDVVDGEILVLMGNGLTQWLLQDAVTESHDFFAVPHAVTPLGVSGVLERAVYARMKVAPGGAVPDLPPFLVRRPHRALDFDAVFRRTTSQTSSRDSQMCTTDLPQRWMALKSSECEAGTAYCWMACLVLDQDCSQNDNVCQNEAGLDCQDDSMDATCAWTCKPPETTTANSTGATSTLSDFCNGKADMLMLGFKVAGNADNPCVILFIEQFTLDTPWKFAVGCVAVAAMGIAIEGMIAFRRMLSSSLKRSVVYEGLRIASFGVNLALGYLAMLVAMTYSVELFISVCVGLVVGHVAFNNMAQAVGETVDPCCAPSHNNETKNKEKGYSNGTLKA